MRAHRMARLGPTHICWLAYRITVATAPASTSRAAPKRMDACGRPTACALQVDSYVSQRSNCNHRSRDTVAGRRFATGTTVILRRDISLALQSTRLRGNSRTVGNIGEPQHSSFTDLGLHDQPKWRGQSPNGDIERNLRPCVVRASG